MDDLIFLHGVALANYRGIGEELQLIGSFKRFNFFIGPNNAGKSCVLNFIAHHLKPWVWDDPNRYNRQDVKDLDALDIHLGASRHQVKMGVGFLYRSARRLYLTNTKIISSTNEERVICWKALLNLLGWMAMCGWREVAPRGYSQ